MSAPVTGGAALALSPLTFGTSSFAQAISRGDDPRRALDRVIGGGAGPLMTCIDTSNEYSGGASERIIGAALREAPRVAPGVAVATKLDRDPVSGRFSGPRMWESLRESLDRLGVDSVPLLYLHDPESMTYEEAFAPGGAVEALLAMRAEGLAAAIGISGGPAPMLTRYVQTGLFDAVITHNRFTLVDRSSESLVHECAARGIVVVSAAPYGSAPLAKWPAPARKYAYRPAHPELAASIHAMGQVSADAGVPLIAAALQFSLRDPRIASTVVGINSAAQLDATLEAAQHPIPDALWEELEALRPGPHTWQEPPGPSPWDAFDIDLTAPHLAGSTTA